MNENLKRKDNLNKMIMNVIKRDGTRQTFDKNRISSAISRAADSVGDKTVKTNIITEKVLNRINTDEETIHIETIQDLIESELMNESYYEIAKSFILYRNERQKQRDLGVLNMKNFPHIDVPWGNAMSYLTFKRTYSRDNEEFRDTVLRVLIGCQRQLKCGFTNQELRTAYEHFMNLRCSTAGRFLWQLSTETVNRLGLMSLQNCAFCTADSIHSFTFLMDVLMLGVGCGMNVQKQNVNKLPQVYDKNVIITRRDTKDADYIVPDSRQGWVALLEKTLEAFFYKGEGFSYSTILIRTAGSPISSFGGVASGPEPLAEGITNICKVLSKRCGQRLRPVDAMDIADIIGSIVVAGNVRRCLPKGSMVHTKKGLIPIENIKVGDQVLTSTGRYENVIDTLIQGKQDLVRINTEDGEFICTPNHKMAVLISSKSNEYKWKMANELRSGDLLATTRIALLGENTDLPIENNLNIPKLDRHIAWFLGLYANYMKNRKRPLVDGAVLAPTYEIAQKADDIIRQFDSRVRSKFYNLGNNRFILSIGFSSVLPYYLEKMDWMKSIQQGSLDVRLGFIAGVIDSGYSTHIVMNQSKEWVRYVQNLCYSCGFETKYTTKFLYKKNHLYHILDVNTIYSKHVLSRIDVLFNQTITKLSFWEKMYNKFNVIDTQTIHRPVSVHKIEKYLEQQDTYDITVDTQHEFYCNGYLTHNSAIIIMGDADDEEYMNAKNWAQGNIPNWRCMSNNSIICNDINTLPESFWNGYDGSGEPYGLINLDLARKVGRLKDGEKYPDPTVEGFNPCVTKDTLILTSEGEKPVEKLIGKRFTAIVGEKGYSSSDKGFWCSGIKLVYKIRLENGYELKATGNHRLRVFCTSDKDEWKEVTQLKTFVDKVMINGMKYSVVESIVKLDEQEVYDCTIESIHCYVSNGMISHNCAEQGLANYETCCLAEIFLPNIENYEQLQSVAITLYRICKHSLLLPCHHPDTEKIVHQNMRMGIGVTGICDCTEEQIRWLEPLYEYLREYDVEYSKKIGCPISVKLTTCKPSGTLSLLPSVSPGVHPTLFQYYIRRIRIASSNPLVELCRKYGYHVEPQLNFDGTFDTKTMVVEFPCKARENTILSKDMSAIRQLELVKRIQTIYSDNSISQSVYFDKEELPLIKDWLKENYNTGLKTVSFFLRYGHNFAQSPYSEITKEQYETLIKKVKPITSGTIYTDDTDTSIECIGGICPIK